MRDNLVGFPRGSGPSAWAAMSSSELRRELSLDALLPTCARWAAMSPEDADPGGLFPLERAQIINAAIVRQREYAAVRQLARTLFPEFGLGPCAIVNGLDRAPRFPRQVVGSLSHSRELALAVLAPRSDVAAIGCDVEPRLPLPDGVGDQVMSKRERTARAGRPDWWDRLLFSAKEAAYKAQYNLSGQFLDFDAFTIAFDPAAPRFTAILQTPAGPLRPGDSFAGRYRVTESFIITVVAAS